MPTVDDCAERNDPVPSEQAAAQSHQTRPLPGNNREADMQAKKAFLEEHKRPGKFSGKYGPQPTHNELVWRMLWGCWLECNDNLMLSKAWNATTKKFSEDWPRTVN